ncbi:MAG: M48 family metalloprotease [Candidatus Omnitrophota bacterium]
MPDPQEDFKARAGRYSTEKYTLEIIDTVYTLILLLFFLFSGASKAWEEIVTRAIPSRFFNIPIYLFSLLILYYLLTLPLNLYRSYYLEHKFSLSTQRLSGWFLDQLKSGIIAYIMGLIITGAFYYILGVYKSTWWLLVSLFWIIFSLIMAKVFPLIIIPLFFKYKELSDEGLKERILRLADKMQVKILECFEIDFSKKTLKANAAFVGWGKTRRVILADTLKDKYSLDEIEVILAHEFAHYRLKHLLKFILVNSAATVVSFYFIYIHSAGVLNRLGLRSLSELSSLPLIFLYLMAFGIITQPLANYLSRVMERNADFMALTVTQKKEAFISMMDKLSLQNLADRKPPALIKFFFFDHPPIDERIQLAKSL